MHEAVTALIFFRKALSYLNHALPWSQDLILRFYLAQHIQRIMHRAVVFKVIVCWGLIDSSLSWSLREWKRDNPSNCVCCVISQTNLPISTLGFYSINTRITLSLTDSSKIQTLSVFIIIRGKVSPFKLPRGIGYVSRSKMGMSFIRQYNCMFSPY